MDTIVSFWSKTCRTALGSERFLDSLSDSLSARYSFWSFIGSIYYTMTAINSFDIFDTLLARTVVNPTDIFDIIEKQFPYKNFKQIRLDAQSRSDQTIQRIYHEFQRITGDSDEMIQNLRTFELTVEKQNTIPIVSNINKLRNGDIFITDMYLTHDEILQLLYHHNINQEMQLYVSSGGKSDGSMWNRLLKTYSIVCHTGDNHHSDIVMANKFNVKGYYTQIHKFTPLEQQLLSRNFDLSKELRRFRLSNPYDELTMEYRIFEQQAQFNVPLLIFMCRQLATICQTEGRNKVLFLSRDGCLIRKLFVVLYPQFQCEYMISSRILNKLTGCSEYDSYLKNMYDKNSCILFDLHGSFSSGRDLFMRLFGHLPRIFIFDYSNNAPLYNDVTYITSVDNRIETLNQETKGSAIGFCNGKAVTMPVEQPIKYISIMHQAMDAFVEHVVSSSLQNMFVESPEFNDEAFWKTYYKNIVCRSERLLNNTVIHTNNTLTTLANKYNSDKGSQYKCAHHYSICYERLISDIFSRRTADTLFAMLEIGLNRDNTSTIPSLAMWNDYFYKNVALTGFDIKEEFLAFNGKYENIRIFVGDQSYAQDLQQLTYTTYDMVIDDGYHASKHQQITFKELWNTVRSGGYYVIEDLHYQPEPETCVATKTLFEHWQNGVWITSEYITQSDIDTITPTIDSIEFYDSRSTLWGDSVKHALVYIRKL